MSPQDDAQETSPAGEGGPAADLERARERAVHAYERARREVFDVLPTGCRDYTEAQVRTLAELATAEQHVERLRAVLRDRRGPTTR